MPLFSFVPEFVDLGDKIFSRVSKIISSSLLLRTVVSLDLDDNCVFRIFPIEEGLLFTSHPHLTHIRIALRRFEDCIYLLSQLGKQLHSLFLTMVHVAGTEDQTIPDVTSVSNCLQSEM